MTSPVFSPPSKQGDQKASEQLLPLVYKELRKLAAQKMAMEKPGQTLQAERAMWTLEFAEAAFGRPDFVGWHICGVIDTWKTMPGKAQRQHCGIMTPTGKFYPEMEQALRDLSSRLYSIGTGQKSK